jgi:preprotein translocase subunit YajC
MGKLFFHMGVFALVTFVIFLVCMWFVRIEDQREAKRRQQNS